MKRQIGVLALGAALTFGIVVGAWAQSGGAGGGTGGGAAGTGVDRKFVWWRRWGTRRA